MAERGILLYGTDEPIAEERPVSAGPLTAILLGGALRSIRLRGVEVIRDISFLVRDRNWATAVPEIRDLEIDQNGDRFDITFSAHLRTPADNQLLVWHGRIVGSASQGLSFSVQATPEEDFQTCRTGFVVLHPLERVVGCPATIEHTDGRIETTTFPDLIDPLQCFFDVRAITHTPVPGVLATCRMEGGAWETEDHRNWLDASFKSYFRPLALPWPYTVTAGETVSQTVSLTFNPPVAGLQPWAPPGETTVAVGDRAGSRMARIALSAEPENLDADLLGAKTVAPLGAQAVCLRIRSDQADLPGVLRKGCDLARRLNASPMLEVVVSARSDPRCELDLVAAAMGSAGLDPAAVVVSPEIDLKSYPPSVDRPPSPPLADLYTAARNAFPDVALGGGMFSFFTELNRRHPPVTMLDFVQHATASNVHAADDRSIMETLESLPHVFRTARSFIHSCPYHVGPAAIAMAFNPYGASTSPNPNGLRRTMVTVDPRHKAQFGASFAAGYLARAAHGGVNQVTMGSLTGPFGVLDGDQLTPMFHVLAGFARLAGAAALQTASSDPQKVLAVAAEGGAVRELWVANLTADAQPVRLAGLQPVALIVMDADSGGKPAECPVPKDALIVLGAYGVARITW